MGSMLTAPPLPSLGVDSFILIDKNRTHCGRRTSRKQFVGLDFFSGWNSGDYSYAKLSDASRFMAVPKRLEYADAYSTTLKRRVCVR